MARVVDEDPDGFRLEYDNTLGKKNVMRLEALTYERAIREARSFLGINAEDRDMEGAPQNLNELRVCPCGRFHKRSAVFSMRTCNPTTALPARGAFFAQYRLLNHVLVIDE